MSHKGIILSPNLVIQRLLISAASKVSMSCEVAVDESQIKDTLALSQYHAVFIDKGFVDQWGEQFLSEIRNHSNTGDSLFVLVSAEPGRQQYMEKLGLDKFLPVPFSLEKFRSMLRVILKLPKKILIAGTQSDSKDTDSEQSKIFVESMDSIESLTKLLESAGLEALKTDFDMQCLAAALQHYPDLILIDISAAGDSMLEMIQSIKEHSLLDDIPILALSMHSEAKTIERFFEVGIQDVLLHPYATKENMQKITSIVSPPKKGKGSKALVIDDSVMIRNMISKMFKQLGYLVEGAENGREGLDVAQKFQPDIITCDYDMPIMNGWEFCQTARNDDSLNHIPIIMVTARGTDVDRKKGSVIGVKDYLVKPFKIDQLQTSVAKVLAKTKADKERVTMSKYMASDVIDRIDADMETESEEKFITMLFSDIKSFSLKCEQMEAKDVVQLLNQYFDKMISVVQHHNGVIDKLIGDAIMARFVSDDPAQDALNAVLAGLNMIEELKKFNTGKEGTINEIKIRIGINSGDVILGNLGSARHRLDFTMIGDNVNIAARLESMAPVMGCLISEKSYEFVADHVNAGQAMLLDLKGKEQKVKAYPILSRK